MMECKTNAAAYIHVLLDCKNLKKIAFNFRVFLRLSSDAKSKFAMISAATLSVQLALHVAVNSQSKKT